MKVESLFVRSDAKFGPLRRQRQNTVTVIHQEGSSKCFVIERKYTWEWWHDINSVKPRSALLWQKEASDKSDISCKRAKCVCHFISTDINGILLD